MSQMYGADTGALRDLSGRMGRGADELEAIARWLLGQDRGLWLGPDADRFFGDCDSNLAPQLRAVIQALRDIALELQRQAEEQDTASGAGGSGGGSGGGGFAGGGGGDGFSRGGGGGSPTGGWQAMPGVDAATTAIDWLSNADTTESLYAVGRFGDLGRPGVRTGAFSVLGVVTGSMDVAQGVSTDDEAMVVSGGIDVGLSTAGFLAAGTVAAPLVGGLALSKSLVEYAVPITETDQYSLLDWVAERKFGKSMADLTLDQSSAMVERYSGPAGIAWMLSDKMDQSADELGKSVEGLGNAVGDNVVGDALRWLGTAGR